jgi:tRNA A58 N-methylase Trm61
VFLTDAKVGTLPDPDATIEAPALPLPERIAPQPVYKASEPTPFDAMRDTLRQGVQVVSAPQLFPTPPEIARRVVELAEIEPHHRILEPSAGTGRMIKALRDALGKDADIVAVEIKAHLAETVLRGGYRVPTHCKDFLQCNGELGTFDRIVMNPPFHNGEDIKHIQHARAMLNPGGRLVAVCANGPRQQTAFQDEAEQWIDLPDDAFKEEGTGVRAAIVVLTAA